MAFLDSEFERRNYCRIANKDFWFDFAKNKLEKDYLNRYGEDFNLVIYKDSNPKEIPYYSIPYKKIKHLLVDGNLKKDGKKWIGGIKKDVLNIKDKHFTLYAKEYFNIHFSDSTLDNIISYPEEISSQKHTEGSVKQIIINAYERDKSARDACIRHFGHICDVCKIDFEEVYGEIGKGFIHVHHIVPISSIKDTYVINPLTDLIPVCPNCHAMLHRKYPPYSTNELRMLLK